MLFVVPPKLKDGCTGLGNAEVVVVVWPNWKGLAVAVVPTAAVWPNWNGAAVVVATAAF